MGNLEYVIGDATSPIGEGRKIIIHCCNNIGGWGSGFVVALSNKWERPESDYRGWFSSGYDDYSDERFALGSVQYVYIQDGLIVCNMIGQQGIGWSNGRAPIRYGAIGMCLEKVAQYAKIHNCSIHAPRFGAGLAGGNWMLIEQMIQAIVLPYGVDVTIYDLPNAEDQSHLIKNRIDMDLF